MIMAFNIYSSFVLIILTRLILLSAHAILLFQTVSGQAEQYSLAKDSKRIIYEFRESDQHVSNSSHPDFGLLNTKMYIQILYNINETAKFLYPNETNIIWHHNPKSGFDGISIILKEGYSNSSAATIDLIRNQTFKNLLNSENLFSVSLIFQITFDPKEYCDCEKLNNQLTEYFVSSLGIVRLNKSISSSIKLGLEYNQRVIECCKNTQFDVLQFFDKVVLRLDISPMNIIFSYGLFSKTIDNAASKNRKFVHTLNKNCELLVRLKYIKETPITDDAHHHFQSFILHYVKSWLEEDKNSELYIVEWISENRSLQSNMQFLRERVSPVYKGSYRQEPLKRTISKVSSTFDSVVFNIWMVYSICDFETNCPRLSEQLSLNLGGNVIHRSRLIIDMLKEDDEEDYQLLQSILNVSNVLNLEVVYFWDGYSNRNTSKWSTTIELLHSKDINIGCFVNMTSRQDFWFAEKISSIYGSLLDVSSEVVYYVYIPYSQQQRLSIILLYLQYEQQLFDKMYPDKILIPYLQFEEPKQKTHGIVEHSYKSTPTYNDANGLYCNNGSKHVHEMYNGILSFAMANNWTKIFLGEVLGNNFETGWWRKVETNGNIPGAIADFQIVVRSTAEKKGEFWKLSETYPCLVLNKDPPKHGIKFIEGGFSGATIGMNLRAKQILSVDEFEAMLQIVLEKISCAEVITSNRKELNVAIAALPLLSRIQFEHMKDYRLSNQNSTLIYLEIPLGTKITDYLKIIQSQKHKHIAVHFSGWERVYEEREKSHTNFNFVLKDNTISLGLTIQNCDQEVNSKLTRLKGLPFIESMRYIVCNVEPVLPNIIYLASAHKYLDTLFYIKSYIEKYIFDEISKTKGFEVIFRINLLPPMNKNYTMNRMETSAFLRFLDNLNQHGVAYKIRYFIVSAFERESIPRSSGISWWHLKNLSDLTDVSLYIDRENEYFDRPTTPLIQLASRAIKTTSFEKHFNVVIAIVIPTILICLLFGICILSVYFNNFRRRYLTEKDMHSFYNGEEISSEILDSESLNWLKMKFPEELEISKRNIEFGEIICEGQFGIVHRGTISGKFIVAVKKPRLGCGKEVFQSCLAEVKMLCYLGNHKNIVTLIGAYTKEIRRGRIYIVMEYCENGSLQNYLRRKQCGNSTLDMYQLYQFSEKIANGMAYIGEKGVVHGDLSTRNVLLTSDLVCKICDFGFSRRFNEMGEYIKKGGEPLPWKWMAPESLKYKLFTTKSDMWSYGITLWEIFSLGAVPYPGLLFSSEFLTDIESGMRMTKAKYASDEIHEDILTCWNIVPEERPSFTHFVEYFSNLRMTEYTTI